MPILANPRSPPVALLLLSLAGSAGGARDASLEAALEFGPDGGIDVAAASREALDATAEAPARSRGGGRSSQRRKAREHDDTKSLLEELDALQAVLEKTEDAEKPRRRSEARRHDAGRPASIDRDSSSDHVEQEAVRRLEERRRSSEDGPSEVSPVLPPPAGQEFSFAEIAHPHDGLPRLASLSPSPLAWLPTSTLAAILSLAAAVGSAVASLHLVWGQQKQASSRSQRQQSWLALLQSDKMIIFVLYALLATSFKFLMSGMRSDYSPTMLLFFVSLLKLVVSAAMYVYSGASWADFLSTVKTHKVSLGIYAVPAVLYAANDVLMMVTLREVDPLTVTVMSSLRNVILSIAWQFLFNHPLGFGQNVGIFLTCLGMFLKELPLTQWGSSGAMYKSHLEGWLMVLLCALFAGSATLWNEKLLKDSSVPILVQNIVFCVYSLFLAVAAHVGYSVYHEGVQAFPTTANGSREITLYVATVIVYAGNGIVAAYFLKSLGNVLRIMSNAAALMLSVVLQALLGVRYSFEEGIGIAVLLLGLGVWTLWLSHAVAQSAGQGAEKAAAVLEARPLLRDIAALTRTVPPLPGPEGRGRAPKGLPLAAAATPAASPHPEAAASERREPKEARYSRSPG
eukprot:TRINITY_DN120771_c0_g1_i1.p1 TRINITY_DN120771_c0_g1~~TRINITY_DN120771_c0_g1_i1.p1  ORF type:complete len:627 (+),score=168.63 TRINITY_DN120771_c0_g1_i1:133-2013(+)